MSTINTSRQIVVNSMKCQLSFGWKCSAANALASAILERLNITSESNMVLVKWRKITSKPYIFWSFVMKVKPTTHLWEEFINLKIYLDSFTSLQHLLKIKRGVFLFHSKRSPKWLRIGASVNGNFPIRNIFPVSIKLSFLGLHWPAASTARSSLPSRPGSGKVTWFTIQRRHRWNKSNKMINEVNCRALLCRI